MIQEHYSDCAVNNGPAYEPGPCDCGGYNPEKRIAILEDRITYAIRLIEGGFPMEAALELDRALNDPDMR